MPNFVKTSSQIKKLSIQRLELDQSVCMLGISYSDPISVVTTNKQRLDEKSMFAKFLFYILTPKRWTDAQDEIDSAQHGDHFCIYQ